MKIMERHRQGVTILAVEGSIEVHTGLPLRDAIKKALDQGVRRILLDLKQVTCFNGCAVGELVAGFSTATNRGGTIKLLTPERIEDILQITQLNTVFETFDSEEEAIDSFN